MSKRGKFYHRRFHKAQGQTRQPSRYKAVWLRGFKRFWLAQLPGATGIKRY